MARLRPATAVAALFFVNGIAFASWIPRIPEVQARLELSTSVLGVALAGVGTGGLVGTVLYPPLARRVGARSTALAAGAAVAVVLPAIAVAPSPWALLAVLVAGGASDALTDIAMNDLGVAEQARAGRSIMNRLHAAWSLGALTGAATSSAVAAAGVGIGAHLVGVGGVSIVVLAVAAPHLSPERPAPRPRSPRRSKVGVAAVLLPLAFAIAVIEAVPAEWSGVVLADVYGWGAGALGLGFTFFAGGMLAGRLAGDAVVRRAGGSVTARLAAALVVVGVAAVTAGWSAPVAVLGFGLAGLGASVLFPVVYGLAGRLVAVSSGSGLALLSLGARLGFLSGPPLVGALADLFDLQRAVAVVVGSAVVAMVVTRSRLERHVAR